MTARTLGIIADDLTGAMDSSGYFASRGLSTIVILNPNSSSLVEADVVVINTNSRADDEGTAPVVQTSECNRECVEYSEGTNEHGVFFRS